MGSASDTEEVSQKFGLSAQHFVEDPDARLYKAFDLEELSTGELLSPTMWAKAIRTALVKGHGAGLPMGNTRQKQGVFLVHDGEIVRSFRHERISDRPDYVALACMPKGEGGLT